jgi:hypothetical protein
MTRAMKKAMAPFGMNFFSSGFSMLGFFVRGQMYQRVIQQVMTKS